ncbi:MAG: thioredoxin domain-containing protein [Balneolaceae bacterium]|nr:thioredoxin domain-containing protein [Balneolaceae bacterium]
MSNKLSDASSPYLQQHANNPVDWHPWGEEAFNKAREENKPVFLSIGYATCHWCHVMAHESFEDPEIAQLLNEAFINIKVDREERPDIDSMYMTVCQMITGQGGWPLNIVMTPEKEPFYAATYIPKDTLHNRIGLRQLVPGIRGMWKNEPEKIEKAFQKIKEGFERSQQFEPGQFPGTETLDYAAEQFAQQFDAEHGGFGSSPKFPSPHNLMFLLRQWKATGDQRFLDMTCETLEAMRLGGIWDHIGYGFHRYSTDREWLLPHFEKMLYDQALLMVAYTEAWQATGTPLFKQTVYEITEYVSRELLHTNGGFYSAEDADSEGEEGRYYVWKNKEIEAVLSREEAARFKDLFGCTDAGNFKEEASGQQTGKNIPHLSSALSETDAGWFNDIRQQLFEARSQRVRPLLDDKILTDWNALMIAAFAKAGFVFKEEQFIKYAESAFEFIQAELVQDKQLMHRYRDGHASINAMGDDYAFLTWALIELYAATSNPQYLEQALSWNQTFIDAFWDDSSAGFFLSIQDEDQIFGRQKQIYDGAIPSSNSVAMVNLLRLSRLTGDTALEEYSLEIGKFFSTELIRSGSSITYALETVQFLENNPREISIVGSQPDIEECLNLYRSVFTPFSVFHAIHPANNAKLEDLASYTIAQTPLKNELTLYSCTNFSCEKPVTGLEAVKKVLVK